MLGTSRRLALAVVVALLPLEALLAACTSFTEAPEGDVGEGTEAGADGGGVDGRTADAAQVQTDAAESDSTTPTYGTLFDDPLDSTDACMGWTANHAASFERISPGANGSPGACRLCANQGDTSASPPSIEKVILGAPPQGTYTFKGSFRASTNPSSATSGNLIGFQFDPVGGTQPVVSTSPVILGPDWQSTILATKAPPATTRVHATIEVHTHGSCIDVDDLELVVTP